MRRGGTLLVVVVVAAIAVAAGVDALRGDSGPDPAARSEPEEPNASTTTSEPAPAAAPFGGLLYYTDESCQLRAAQLPGLDPAEAPNWDECAFVLSPDGRSVAGEGSGWDPHSDPLRGRLFESEGGQIQVSTNGGPEGEPFRGQAPAWRPDGTLTFFGDGAVREWPTNRVVFSAAELAGAVMTHFNAPADRRFIRTIRVRHLAWLDQDHAVLAIHAVVPQGADLDLATVSENGRLATTVDLFAPITALWPSPQGRFWSIAADTFQLFARNGDNLPLPQLTDPRAVAWSPDDRWMAVATRASVFVFPPGESEPVTRLPVAANDLDWRGDPEPPTIAEAGAAREWLGGVGATGRLVLAQSDDSGCAVRTLRLPGLEWAERPPGPSERCRFTLDYRGVVVPESIVPRPGRGEWAECREGAVEWANESGPVGRYRSACAPEWTPDGRLTFVRDGSLYQAWTTENGRVLLPRGKLGELMGRPSSLEEIAWLDDERFWAVVRSGESAIVALLTTERLVFSPSFTTREIEDLQVSATGMVAARTDQGVVFFDSGGRRALTFPNGHAVAWAPGELFAAVATPGEVLFVAPVSREVVPISLAVRDLEWVVP